MTEHKSVAERMSWANRKIVYPWDQKHFFYTMAERELVYDYLRKRNYPITKLLKRPKSEKLVKAATMIMERVLQRKWVLMTSNHAGLLQAIARTVPPCFALTTLEPCDNVSTADLLALFTAKPPKDMWAEDPAGEAYIHVAKTGLLTWSGVSEGAFGSKSHASRFGDLLNGRRALHFPTLFTATYLGKFTPEKVGQIMKSIEEAIGLGPMIIIKEKAEVINFMMEGVDERVKVSTVTL